MELCQRKICAQLSFKGIRVSSTTYSLSLLSMRQLAVYILCKEEKPKDLRHRLVLFKYASQ